MYGSQRGGQTGVLHADLDGDGAALGLVQLQQLSYHIAQQISQHVVQDDNHDNQQTGGHQVRGVRGYYGCHDRHDRQGRNQRQNLYHRLGEFLEEMVNQEAQHDGQDHNLYDGKEHAPDIHVYRLSGVEIGQSRGQERRQNRGTCRHSYGKGHITLGEIGHHVGRGSSGAGAYQDDADGQLRAQAEHLGKGKGQKRHDGKLRAAADDDVLGAAEHDLEVMGLQRQAHAEHYDSQQGINVAGLQEADR